VNAKVRDRRNKRKQQLAKRKEHLKHRIDPRQGFGESHIVGKNIKYELSEKQHAISCGGIGLAQQLIKQTNLREHINQSIPLFKFHAPYAEADHVFNMAFNLLTGGTCLEHLEHRRTDEAYLDALGAQRIPDPTTAGDFCRRFDTTTTLMLMQAINKSRQIVWKQQPDAFFDHATIEADGSMVETAAEKKDGIGLNYKGQWGYCPLVVTLAETQELLYLYNRPGNRPSHEHASFYLDLAVEQCREAGFRKITLRGDTDFSQTEHLDRWDAQGVEFIFGYDAAPNLIERAESLDKNQWKRLNRRSGQTDKPRAKRENIRQQIVEDKGYKDLLLVNETCAEFDYQPTKCSQHYRMVVVRKEIECSRGQQRMFDDDQVRYFFYITNKSEKECSTRQVIHGANQRCNQENTISQLKASHCLKAPLDNLDSNWAYMVIASLAWTLKQWSGLMVRVKGNPNQRAKPTAIREWLVRMEFATFLNSLILIPAQVLRSARQTTLRLLTYRRSVDALFLVADHISKPLRQ